MIRCKKCGNILGNIPLLVYKSVFVGIRRTGGKACRCAAIMSSKALISLTFKCTCRDDEDGARQLIYQNSLSLLFQKGHFHRSSHVHLIVVLSQIPEIIRIQTGAFLISPAAPLLLLRPLSLRTNIGLWFLELSGYSHFSHDFMLNFLNSTLNIL